MTAFSKMYYPKLTFASSIIEGIFLFGILCLSNKIYGLDPKISLEVSKSCIWKKPKLASEQHPLCSVSRETFDQKNTVETPWFTLLLVLGKSRVKQNSC